MKRSSWILGVVTSIVGSFAGCNKAAPTEPVFHTEDTTAISSPAGGHSGAWSGQIEFHPYNGNYVVLSCNGAEPISVLLAEDGEHLNGKFLSACGGSMEIRGIVGGGSITGSLEGPSGLDYGKISGTISGNRIQFKAIKTIDEDGDGRADGKGHPPVVSAVIDLHRSPERASPIAVDRSRSPRVLPARQ